MVDALGSRDFIRGPRWRQLREAGVHLLAALEDIPRLGRFAVGRVDLRNHRKLVVIDNRIAFCGSQNCADPQFRVKAKYAPWIDILLRCEGPVVRQAQHLFLATWIAETGEDLYGLPAAAPEPERHARRRGRADVRHRADHARQPDVRLLRQRAVRRRARADHHHALLRAR